MWIKDFLKEKLKEKIVNQKTCKDYTTWGIKVIWFFIQINGWFVLPIIFTNKWDYMHDQIQCTNKKKYYLEMFVAKSSIQKVEMMHISQLYVLSINIDGITRTIRWKNRKHIWWETLQHITKHQTCLQHLLWHQAFSTYCTKIKITRNTY